MSLWCLYSKCRKNIIFDRKNNQLYPSAQPQQIVIPTSGGGTQMIVNGALNGAVQPFVMQQVMQIQDPNTGQIQTGMTVLLYCLSINSRIQ